MTRIAPLPLALASAPAAPTSSLVQRLWPKHGVRLTLDLPCQNKAGFDAYRSSAHPLEASKFSNPSQAGLDTLHISGSSEFTPAGLKAIIAQTPAGFHLLDVDIRQESHGYDGSVALGWWKRNNSGNEHKSLHALRSDEAARLDDLQDMRSDHHYIAYAFKNKETLGKRVTMRARNAYDEATLARSQGVSYARIPMTDRASAPSDATVDLFVQQLLSLREDTWVHFHCLHGHGRTTLFMAMYDMLRNANQVSLADIVARQYLMGGVDLSRKSEETQAFMRRFHTYAKDCIAAVKEGKQVPLWSHWHPKKTLLERLQSYIEM